MDKKAKEARRRQLLVGVLKLHDFNLTEAEAALRETYKSLRISDMASPSFTKKPFKKPEGDPLIVAKDLTKVYKNGREKLTAVDKASFEIWQGEFIALTGASGSGKSTLLHMLGGLDKPTSGSIVINKENIAKLSDRKLSNFRNRTIGFVFQFFYMQPFLTLAQNIAVPSMIYKMSSKDRKKRVAELAEAVGLSDRLKHLPKELSGGQMQRAAIARALFNSPKIILADEPTGNLDSKNSQVVIELFKEIREKFGTTIIVVTHDREIANQADREITMKDGVIVWLI